MNRNVSLTDIALREVLATRARNIDGSELAGDVLAAIATIPQRPLWPFRFARPKSLMPILVGLVLLPAALIGAALIGAQVRRDAGADVIAYTEAQLRWSGGVAADSAAIMRVDVGDGSPTHLVDVSATLYAGGSYARVGPAVKWSPDGSRIAFRSDGLYVMNRDGSDLRLIAEAVDEGERAGANDRTSSFAWSPDSSRIAFISPNKMAWPPGSAPNGRLWVVDVESGALQPLADAANGSVSWSPDGSRVAFGRSRQWTSDVVILTTANSEELSYRFDGEGVSHPGAIAWSPDGSLVAFDQTRFGADREGEYLMVLNSRATEAREITHVELSGCCYHGAFGGLLAWSPDGSLLAKPHWTDDGVRIRVIAADGSGIRSEFRGDWFDWSPDGSQLVFSAPGPTIVGAPSHYRSSSIFISNVDGTGSRWIADGDYPAWSP